MKRKSKKMYRKTWKKNLEKILQSKRMKKKEKKKKTNKLSLDKYENWISIPDFNPFPNNDTFWHVWERSLFKTLWEKKKMLFTSIFSFSHNVFYLIQDRNHHLCYTDFVVC